MKKSQKKDLKEWIEIIKSDWQLEIVLHFLKICSTYSPFVLVILKMQYMNKNDWDLTTNVCDRILRDKQQVCVCVCVFHLFCNSLYFFFFLLVCFCGLLLNFCFGFA